MSWPNPKEILAIAFDFDGVFTDNKVYVSQEGVESVRCDRGDGLGIGMLRQYRRSGKLSAEIFILSKEKNPVVSARAAKLKIDCHQTVSDKVTFLDNYFREKFPNIAAPYSKLVYLGNDLNDLPVFERAGFCIAPSDAHERVKKIASVILPQRGGDGFVRAFVEKLLGIDQLSSQEIRTLVSEI